MFQQLIFHSSSTFLFSYNETGDELCEEVYIEDLKVSIIACNYSVSNWISSFILTEWLETFHIIGLGELNNISISAYFLVFMNGAVAMYQMNLKLVVNCKINQGAHVETDLSAVSSGAIRIIL